MCYWQPVPSFKNRRDNCQMWSNFLAIHTSLAAAFWTGLFEVCLVSTEGNLKVNSYSSLTEKGQESIQGFGLLGW